MASTSAPRGSCSGTSTMAAGGGGAARLGTRRGGSAGSDGAPGRCHWLVEALVVWAVLGQLRGAETPPRRRAPGEQTSGNNFGLERGTGFEG